MDARSALDVGVRLFGLYLLVSACTALITLLATLESSVNGELQYGRHYSWAAFLLPVVLLVAGYVCSKYGSLVLPRMDGGSTTEPASQQDIVTALIRLLGSALLVTALPNALYALGALSSSSPLLGWSDLGAHLLSAALGLALVKYATAARRWMES